ncbi:RHS repeat-associated core domain-containing protein [Pseudomonas entomophila]|uniref:RHS repeat-associated core domain-containing protein n=1 Tax=Pseudomonas entomophila TaxID=312306 RepID=UPI0015E3EB6F|nr:RHS repeat-associated core domain-containing protein [Pseudomonas entomophila]MBA1187895.1 RHS repeat-associated core domain-containing protein [Pseudomonas entomophila]
MKMRDCTWSNRFYLHDRFVAEVGARNRRLVWASDSPVAACDHRVRLLETDGDGSLLRPSDTGAGLAYTPHGHASGLLRDIPCGFNGQRLEHAMHGYALGNGKRFYCPSLQRFLQPDRMSPFLAGGLNAYAYCQGDPVNRADPSGHLPQMKSPAAPKILPVARHSALAPLFTRDLPPEKGRIRLTWTGVQVGVRWSDIQQALRSSRLSLSNQGLRASIPLDNMFSEFVGGHMQISKNGIQLEVPTFKVATTVRNVSTEPLAGALNVSVPYATLLQSQKRISSTRTTIDMDWKTAGRIMLDNVAEKIRSPTSG